MTGLAEQGFLSDEIAGVMAAVEQRYASWLVLFRTVNARAVRAQYEAKIHRAYLPELVAAATYMRTLTNVQAAVLLITRGADAPARILLRASLESLFKLKAVERDRNVVNAIVAGDDEFRQKLYKKYQRIDNPELRAELERVGPPQSDTAERFKEWGVKPLNVEQMAAKADLTTLYLSTYPVLSDTVHAGIRDLERHVETTATGEIVALTNVPNIEGLELLFLMAIEFLIAALEGFAEIVGIALGESCNEWKRSLKMLTDATHQEGD